MESVNHAKMKHKKQEKENIPAVTWIAMQPQTTSRTSLKSVSDYLSETQDEIPMPKRRLCLSPDTLNALENAEKLVEDVERQISQMNINAFLIDDLETDKFDDKSNKDENIYIRNVVASTFQKGYYDPGPRAIFDKEKLKSKYTLAELSKFKSLREMCNSARFPQSASETARSKVEQTSLRPVTDDCLVCKSTKTLVTKTTQKDNIAELSNEEKNIAEKKIDEDKPEKLNVQKGPIISIQGDLSIQTKKIIDIQPDETVRQASDERLGNIVTYEIRHKSCRRDKSSSLEMNGDDSSKHMQEKPETDVGSTTDGKLKSDKIRSRRSDRRRAERAALDKRRNLSEDKQHRAFDFQIALEDVDWNLEDFSLTEPLILTEVDTVLEQQRKIIRQVHNATERFDRFLATRSSSESYPIPERRKDEEDYLTKKRKIEINNAKPIDSHQRKIPQSYESDQIPEKNRMIVRENDELKELPSNSLLKSLSEADSIFSFNKGSSAHESDVGKEVASYIKEAIVASEDTQSSKNSSIDSKISETSRKVADDSDLQKKSAPSAEESKDDVDYSESFESTSSASETDKSDSRTSRAEQSKISDKKFSSNVSLMSVHTKTKSSVGFIENLKDAQLSKDNNLDANPYRQKESVSETFRIIESKNHSANEIEEHITKQKSRNNESDNCLVKEHRPEEKEKDEKYASNDEVENKKGASTTEKSQEQPDENSQKTSHLIESISETSFCKISEEIKNSQDSNRLSKSSQNSKSADLTNTKEATTDESRDEKSTESKIESKLSEARDNLNSLMRSMNDSNALRSINGESNNRDSNQNFDENFLVPELPMKLKNDLTRNDDSNKRKIESVVLSNVVRATQEHTLSDTRLFITMLEENSSVVMESCQQRKLSLLKKLESCSIPSKYQGSRLFTSTVLGEMEPPNSFARLKGSSESSSETHSEGEVCFSSSASYSLGEVRRRVELSKSNSHTKDSSSNNSNCNASLQKSIGEICGKPVNF